jgi:1-pyrroline-5-carboxylate dehydrogenase
MPARPSRAGRGNNKNQENSMSSVPAFATVNPFSGMTGNNPGILQNLVAGSWEDSDSGLIDIIDPMNGEVFLKVPDTREHAPFIAGLRSCPKSGMHNPLKNPDRYVALGQVCAKAAALLAEKEVNDYFTKLIMRVMPKSWNQASWRAVFRIPVTIPARNRAATAGRMVPW